MDASSTENNSQNESSKKYIRTFAGDMAAVQKGAPPDLAPLGSSAAPKPFPPASPPSHTPASTPPPAPLSRAEIPSQTVPSASKEANTGEKVPPLQTYTSDFSERIKNVNASSVTVLAAEQDSLPPPAHIAPLRSPSRAGLFYLLAGVVLFAASVGGIYGAYRYYAAISTPVTPPPAVPTPIFVDEREEIFGDGAALVEAVGTSARRSLAAGTVRLLHLASTTDIFPLLPLSAPDVLMRNLNPTGSMAGIVNAGGEQSPFFILSVSSYSSVLSGMLAWEPLMSSDLRDLFPSLSGYPMDGTASTTATTTSAAGNLTAVVATVPFGVSFIDVSVANHDARAYRDASGRDVLIYGFWDRATLVIARDTAAFAEILGRLATSRVR